MNNVRTQFSNSALGSNRAVRGFGNSLTANGHSPYENTYRLDGINENDYSNGAPGSPAGVILGVDAIQEFSVVTTAYTAEYGRTSGAVINAVTRSGSNVVHGSAYIFDRDKIFDAENPFDKLTLTPTVIPPFHRTQFGGTVGFPIRRDKTFFFANYEGLRQSQSVNLIDVVPTAAARANAVAAIVPYLALYPLPNVAAASAAATTAQYATTGLIGIKENFLTARFDNNFGQKDLLTLTFLVDNAPQTVPDAYNNYQSLNSDRRYLAGITERHIFSPNLLNVLRIGYSRTAELGYQPLQAFNTAASNTTLGYFAGLTAPLITVTGLTAAGGLGSGRLSITDYNSFQVYDDVSFTRGKHSLKFGYASERINSDGVGPLKNGNVSFTSLANFLNDAPASAQVPSAAGYLPVEAYTNLFAGYVQDDWKIASRLTLNLGLRYEFITIPTDRKNRLGLINTLSAAAGSGPCPTVISATSIPGCIVPVNGFFQSNPTTRDFEPRIGFSYDVFGNGKTALRGASGIYDLLPLPYFLSTYSLISTPYSQDRLGVNTIPVGAFPGAVPVLLAAQPSTRAGHYIDPNPHRDYSLNYNLNVEQQYSKSLSSSLGYVGSHSVHLPFQTLELNQVGPSQVQVINGRYVWPLAGVKQDANNSTIYGTLFDNSSHYSGLLAQLKVSDYHGLILQGSYTWSSCTDYGPTNNATTYTNTIGGLVYFDKPQRKGTCDFILKNNFTGNFLYQLASPKERFAAVFAGGWQVGGIVIASSGSPFSLLNSGDVLGQKGLTNSAFPDFIQGCNPYNNNFKGNGHSYINSTCFSFPTVAAGSTIAPLCNQAGVTLTNGQVLCTNLQGDERRNQLIGPPLIDTDLSLIKNTHLPHLSEIANLQLRFEAFNVFNHSNFQAPTDNLTFAGRVAGTANVGPGTAGLLTSTATPSRQIQLGAKVIF